MIEAHHYGDDKGMGIKCSDYDTAPLCSRCHRFWHQHGRLPELTRAASVALMTKTRNEIIADRILGLLSRPDVDRASILDFMENA